MLTQWSSACSGNSLNEFAYSPNEAALLLFWAVFSRREENDRIHKRIRSELEQGKLIIPASSRTRHEFDLLKLKQNISLSPLISFLPNRWHMRVMVMGCTFWRICFPMIPLGHNTAASLDYIPWTTILGAPETTWLCFLLIIYKKIYNVVREYPHCEYDRGEEERMEITKDFSTSTKYVRNACTRSNK